MFGTSEAKPECRFTAPAPPGPTITIVSPAKGSGGAPITVTGTGFALPGVYAVSFGPTTVHATATSLTAVTVNAPASGSGPVPLQVNNEHGHAVWSDTFTLGVPVVNGVSPASGPATGKDPVTIKGYGFDATCTVNFDDKPAKAEFVDANTITATPPAVLVLGTHKVVEVTVANNAGSSPSTPDDQYLYYPDR
jgi:hypothetical protein